MKEQSQPATHPGAKNVRGVAGSAGQQANVVRGYYYLVKPGIIRGNIVTATAGFLLASGRDFDFGLYLAAIGGLSLVIASGCVVNNYLDRKIDAAMDRTKSRALVTGRIAPKTALVFAGLLGLAGFGLLLAFTTLTATLTALLGYFFYTVMYSIWKRRSAYSTIIGSISGAVPPVVGYTAVSGKIDAAAVILFAILVLWQMPHFYAIGIFRRKEYQAAGVPILPVKLGVHTAKLQILVYIGGFIAATALLTSFDYTSYAFAAVMAITGAYWLWIGVSGFDQVKHVTWAKRMFKISLLVILIFSLGVSLDSLIYQGGV